MRPFACLLRVLALLSATPLAAQLFMSSFSEVKYDRVKNPAVFHGGAKVDPITGSVSLDIPLGPGIGARGAEYVPTLRLRCSPQVYGKMRFDQYSPGYPNLPAMGGLYYYPPLAPFVGSGNESPKFRIPDILKGFTGGINPGMVQMNVHPTDDLLKTTTIDLPNGESGTAFGVLPVGMDVPRLLADFGYGAYSVSKEPGATATTQFGGEPTQTAAYLAQQRVKDFVRATTGGGILIGLKGSGYADVTWRELLLGFGPSSDPLQPFQNPLFESITFPAILLLIKGDVAYEFVLSTGFRTNLSFSTAAGRGERAETLESVMTHAVYLVHRILNRVGDELRFEPFPIPDPNPQPFPVVPPHEDVWSLFGGPGTVTWYRNGVSTGISLKGTHTFNGGTPQDALFNERIFHEGSQQSVQRLEYQGVNHSAYTIASNNWVDGPFPTTQTSKYDAMQLGASTTITQEASGETVRLLGTPGKLIPASSFGNNVSSQVISEIQFPTHTLKLDWDFYEYVRGSTAAQWGGHGRSPWLYWAYGVTKVTDVDPRAPDQPRVTQYQRIVPRLPYRSDFNNLTWDDRMEWTERRQLAAVTHPDGGTTLFKYFEPPALGVNDGPGAPNDTQLLGMAALKHVVKEERHYKAGTFNFANIEGSTPYLTVDHSALSLRHLCNPDGLASYGNMPYAGSTVTRDLDTGVVTTESKGNWDATHYGWKTQTKTVTGGGKTFDRSVQRTYEFVPVSWLGPRVTWEQAMGKAAVQRTYDDKNRVATETHNDKGAGNTAQDPSLKLTFTYNTLTQAQPDRITLTSTPALSLSGSVGAAYTYDTFGYMKTIEPFGAPGYLEQVNDAFGRATAQYDMNRQRIDIQWRTDGRLGSITPPGEVAISYTYDADARGVTIQRGAGPKSQLRYNGFGEIVLERRWNGSGIASNRLSSFDTMGRKRWESLWDSGIGGESNWTLDVPPAEIPLPTGGGREGRCLRWGIGPGGIAECVEWEVIAAPPAPPPPIAGLHYQYDGRGRLTQTLAPGNTGSTITYSGLRKTVTSGLYWNNSALVNRGVAATTSFDSDALGRLVGVTDALSQPTTYAYDDADRVTQVAQVDPAYTSRTQTRSWAYNTLGWPQSLTQPESGTTSYSAFDVSGKPWTTSYNGRVVNATFDALGRTLSAWAPDGSVNQAFTWDTAPANGKGKLRAATANGVTREMDYGGVGGRLSTLARTVDGIPFVQRFTYDTYGNLSSRTYPDNKVQTLTPDLATGLPVTSVFNGVSVMPVAVYDATHWGLTKLTLANGATSFFTYGPDQTRLDSLRHQVSGKLDRRWGYGYDDQSRLLSAVGTDYQNTVGFRQDEERYTYDALGRLKTAMVRDPWDTTTGYQNRGLFQRFDYDPFGNRFVGNTGTISNWPANQPPATTTPSASLRAGLDKAVANVAFSRTEASFLQNRLPASAGAVYDAQGNLTQVFPRVGASGEAVNLVYDALGRVSSMSYGPTATRKSESYLHDDEGLRILVWDGAKYRYNVYNEARQLIAQYEKIGTGSLTWKKDILYVGTKELAEVSSDGKTYVTLNDHLGGPRFLYDGTTLSQQKFLPFGEGLADALSAAKFAKGFTNHEQTDASGLIYMQARFYAPWYGRFLSPDPARDQHFEETQSWNIYSYVQNNPTMKIDPTGMWTKAQLQAKRDEFLNQAKVDSQLGRPETIGQPQTNTAVAGSVGAVATRSLVAEFGAWLASAGTAVAPYVAALLMVSDASPAALAQQKAKEAKKDDAKDTPTENPVSKTKPPNHPDFKPDKKKPDYQKVPWDKNKKGFPARNKDYWEPVPDGHKGTHEPHWDVQHPDGSHTPVYPILD